MTNINYMTDFTFQKEWVEKRGLLLVLAFFLGGVGGGLYLVSSFFHFYPGMIVSVLIVALGKGGAHLMYLGKPVRFWRALLRPQSSWIARGIIAVIGFIFFTGLQLAPTIPWLSWLPWTASSMFLQVLALAFAVVLITYTGFALAVLRAIPFWNSSVMPLLFIQYSVLGGAGLTLGMMTVMGHSVGDVHTLETIVRYLMIASAVSVVVYLWVSYHVHAAARFSVMQIVKGRISPLFFIGVVLLGFMVPMTVSMLALSYNMPPSVVVIAVACELLGSFSLRYIILKAGVYAPIV